MLYSQTSLHRCFSATKAVDSLALDNDAIARQELLRHENFLQTVKLGRAVSCYGYKRHSVVSCRW